MNRPLVIIIMLSIIYLLMIALSPGAQKVQGKFPRLEYGYIDGKSPECMKISDSKSQVTRLHFFTQRDKGKTRVEFFCHDIARKPVKSK